MSLQTITGKRVGDTYYKLEHPSGLTVFIYPKENSNSTYAVFGTKYGSVDNQFRRSDEDTVHTVPEGIAHFLEHKLFESEDGDAFARYAKTGASANAYTSFDMTCYLFSCTENVEASLEILLDFVQSPYFTEQTVQKEQGIIGQEIRMYDDDPQWRVMFNLLGALYHTHPVKIDIAGTVESISHITPELLYQCYHTFYDLHNMALCVAGNIDKETVLKLVDKYCKPAEPFAVDRVFEEEPRSVVKGKVTQALSVATPLFQFGFKEEAGKNRRTVKELAAVELLLEILASEASPLFRELQQSNLINESSFSYEFFDGPGYASVIFAGESKNPDQVADCIKKEVNRLRKEGIPKVDFERAKKAIYGRNVAALNSSETIANCLIALSFSNRELFEYIDALAEITLEEVTASLQTHMLEQYAALSIVEPITPMEEAK